MALSPASYAPLIQLRSVKKPVFRQNIYMIMTISKYRHNNNTRGTNKIHGTNDDMTIIFVKKHIVGETAVAYNSSATIEDTIKSVFAQTSFQGRIRWLSGMTS